MKPTIGPVDRRAAQQQAEKLIRRALGVQYAIYKKIKKDQKIGGAEK